jgi:hypothetical protein
MNMTCFATGEVCFDVCKSGLGANKDEVSIARESNVEVFLGTEFSIDRNSWI